ncbi:MAG: hypothetical protein PHU69_13460 [Fermentimonas sp.]|nr:hypothetical protein [Fermentimonas sp.]
MDRATYIRGQVLSKFDKITLSDGSKWDALNFNNALIPVFDEFVNPKVPIPSVGGAQEAYIILQDQQTNMNAVQTVCAPRFNISMTIRIVTKWGLTGSKKLCEDIGDTVINLLRDDRGASKINGISHVELVTARSMSEESQTNIAFSKILILNFIKNG